jgi:hypothetical protein
LILLEVVGHAAVGQVRDGVTKSGQLPVKDCQNFRTVTGKDEVIQPCRRRGAREGGREKKKERERERKKERKKRERERDEHNSTGTCLYISNLAT